MSIVVTATPLEGLMTIETRSHVDERGRFSRLFCAESFAPVRPGLRFVQVNHSITTTRGTVRGMHLQQAPVPDAKLVWCLRGRVFDVAVDLRMSSPTFGAWHGIELAEGDGRALFIPEGVAHGFQALTDDVHLLYQHTAAYAPSCESGVHHGDPSLGITWPLPVTLVSARDACLPTLLGACSRGTA